MQVYGVQSYENMKLKSEGSFWMHYVRKQHRLSHTYLESVESAV